jgi:hypothetical protein
MWGKKIKYIRFNNELKVLKDKEFDFSKSSFSPLGYLETSEKGFFIDNRWNRKTKNWELSVAEDHNGTITGQRSVINHAYKSGSALFGTATGKYGRVDKDKIDNLAISNSSNYVCYVNSSKGFDDNKNEFLNISLFDANFDLLWSKGLETNEKDKELLLIDYVVTNDGIVYLLFQKGFTKKNKEFILYHVSEDSIDMKSIELESEVINCQIESLSNGDLLTVGYFKDKSSSNKFGKFIKLFDPLKGFYNEYKYSTEIKDVNDFYQSIKYGFGLKEAKEILTKYIVVYEDGSIQLIDEQIEISPKNGVTLSSLLIYSLDKDYKIQSSETINRKILNPKWFNISPIIGFNKGKTILTYVDRIGKIRDLGKLKYMYAILNSKGIEKNPSALIDSKELKFRPSNKDSFIFGDGLYIFSRKGDMILQKFQYNYIEIND